MGCAYLFFSGLPEGFCDISEAHQCRMVRKMGKRIEQGLTLLESLVALVLLAVVAVNASTGLSSWLARHRLIVFQHDVYRAFMLARQHAITHGTQVVVCPLSAKEEGCASPKGDWNQGWRVFETLGSYDCLPQGDGLCGHGGRVLLEHEPVREGFRIVVNSHLARRARFNAMGMSHGYNGRLTVCSRQDVDSLGLVIAQSGRVRNAQPEELLACEPDH